jgi:hypothetical protein
MSGPITKVATSPKPETTATKPATETKPVTPKPAKAPVIKAPPKLTAVQVRELHARAVASDGDTHLAISKTALLALTQEVLDLRTAWGLADAHTKKINRRLADIVKVVNAIRGAK